jgi:hypothetical protein
MLALSIWDLCRSNRDQNIRKSLPQNSPFPVRSHQETNTEKKSVEKNDIELSFTLLSSLYENQPKAGLDKGVNGTRDDRFVGL